MFLYYVEAVSKFGFESKNTANIIYVFFYLENTYQIDLEIPEYRNNPGEVIKP